MAAPQGQRSHRPLEVDAAHVKVLLRPKDFVLVFEDETVARRTGGLQFFLLGRLDQHDYREVLNALGITGYEVIEKP